MGGKYQNKMLKGFASLPASSYLRKLLRRARPARECLDEANEIRIEISSARSGQESVDGLDEIGG